MFPVGTDFILKRIRFIRDSIMNEDAFFCLKLTEGIFMIDPAEEEHFKTLFEYAPISLWEEDYSNIKRLFDGLRQQGILSLESYLDDHPGFVDECIQQMNVLDVNQQTLSMFKADSKDALLSNLGNIFRDGMRHHFRDELLALWNGESGLVRRGN